MTRYRVWIHPKRGSVYYFQYASPSRAVLKAVNTPHAEQVIYKVTGRGTHEVEKRMSAIERQKALTSSHVHHTARRQTDSFGLPKLPKLKDLF